MKQKITFVKADLDLASALNASDRDMDLRSDLDSGRSFTKQSQMSGSTFMKKSEKDRAYKAETLSEPYDAEEKEALYGHSMSKGLFKNIRNSPLREKMPARMQLYEAYGNATFGQNTKPQDAQLHDFKEFKPAEDKSLNFESDFSFNPKKFFCKQHPGQEVEFCCEITEEFYCRKCAPNHQAHTGDRVLSSICLGL